MTMNSTVRYTSNVIKVAYNRLGLFDSDIIKSVCHYLNTGGVVAIPTDTIYGLAAKADDVDALDKIYQIKGRDKTKPLALCLATIEEIDHVAETSQLNKRVLPSLLPGPVTILLKRSQNLNAKFNPGLETVGIRVPDYDFVRVICEAVGPLALTSANKSGEASPLNATDFEELWPEVDCVINSGALQNILPESELRLQRLGSTVVDLTEKNLYKIVREGCALNRTIRTLDRFGYRRNVK